MNGCRCVVPRDGEHVLVQVHGLPSSTAPEATLYPCGPQRTLQQGSSLQKPHRGCAGWTCARASRLLGVPRTRFCIKLVLLFGGH